MKFIIIIPILLLAASCIKPTDTSPHIAPADMDADYCLDLKGPDPVARLVKKYRDLEPALLNIPEKPYLECDFILLNEYYYFYFFEKERNWDFPTIGYFFGTSNDNRAKKRWKISPVVQVDFPESEIIYFINFDGRYREKGDFLQFEDEITDYTIHKKEELLLFENKIIDVEIYKYFRCKPSLDTILSIKFRARITGECESWPQPPWNIGASGKDSVVAKLSPGGTLVIGGNGKMMDFDFITDNRPWLKICEEENIKIAIDSGVTYIGSRAFANCKNTISITIPRSVTYIGDDAFANCIKLTSIIILNPTPPSLEIYETEIMTFYEVDTDTCTLYVPKGSVEAYRNADGWKEFENIKPIE